MRKRKQSILFGHKLKWEIKIMNQSNEAQTMPALGFKQYSSQAPSPGIRRAFLPLNDWKTLLEKGSVKQMAVLTRAFQHQLNWNLTWKTKKRGQKIGTYDNREF